MSAAMESSLLQRGPAESAPRLIRQLSSLVVNQIAAGEVIERPASVLKELLENALDAGAQRVEVSLEQGGTQLIRVTDNGCGIEYDQLPLAIASHATSKISDADDLFRVSTLGFRGEALASISAVSQFTLRSRSAAGESGGELECVGGEVRGLAPCGMPVGTTVEVRNLFFNTPVRRKFLRSTQTELGHLSEAFTRLALAWPGVHFVLRHNERVLFDLPPSSDWSERIGAFFGSDLRTALIEIHERDEPIGLSGYVVNPTHSRHHNRMQYLFLNGRHIRDRALQHALGEAYRGLLMVGRFPICFLRLEMPAELVDVNVHPTKLEVRFQDSGRVYSQMLGAIRKRFLSTDLTARVVPAGGTQESAGPAAVSPAAETARRELVDWAKGALAAAKGNANGPGGEASSLVEEQQALELQFEPQPGAGLRLTRIDPASLLGTRGAEAEQPSGLRLPEQPVSAPRGAESPFASSDVSNEAAHAGDATPKASSGSFNPSGAIATAGVAHRTAAAGGQAIQVHNKYLVAETDEGVIVIDQHALHERILFEYLKDKLKEGPIESQRLLVPEAVDLAGSEAAAILEAKEMLAELGIGVESLGGTTVLVSSYPSLLANFAPGEVLRNVLEALLSGGRTVDRREVFDRLLHGIACKAAIKAGDRLTAAEIESLVHQRHLAQDAHHCPHGRPTSLVFTREELDRRFGRI